MQQNRIPLTRTLGIVACMFILIGLYCSVVGHVYLNEPFVVLVGFLLLLPGLLYPAIKISRKVARSLRSKRQNRELMLSQRAQQEESERERSRSELAEARKLALIDEEKKQEQYLEADLIAYRNQLSRRRILDRNADMQCSMEGLALEKDGAPTEMVDQDSIREEILKRPYEIHVSTNWLTPSGRRRSAPIYETTIENEFLGKVRTIKSKSTTELESTAKSQIHSWAELEFQRKVQTNSESEAIKAREGISALRNLLRDSLQLHHSLDWNSLLDTEPFPEFKWTEEPPPNLEPVEDLSKQGQSLFEFLIPALKKRREERIREEQASRRELAALKEDSYLRQTRYWESRKASFLEEHRKMEMAFYDDQKQRNQAIGDFRTRFESGEPDAIVEYLNEVFEKSEYPEVFPVSHEADYEKSSQTAVVNITLPSPDDVPNITDYTYLKRTGEIKPVLLKKKDHEEMYDAAVKQSVLRTVHETFEAVYTEHVMTVVVNGWVTYVDKSTGLDKTSCIISVAAEREVFEKINLERIDLAECIKSLKGLVAGPLAQVAPVQPVLQLDRNDPRFVESEAVLADLNSKTNLATIDWEAFEHLVRELFQEMFARQDAEVRVTQASRDGGVDAIAFDPDPIRGGKFVIQAKRYTKVVPVSAVRDLYGTVLNEGASRGILVTTAYYGRDARAFAKDKPLTLIDGPNLVYLLEEHGHKVRIDLNEARGEESNL